MTFLRRSIPILMLIALMGGIAGCNAQPKEPPKPATPPPPPPPTPEQISAKIIAEAGLNDPLPAAGAGYSREQADKLMRVLKNASTANSQTPEGKSALQIVQKQLEQRMHALESAGAWEHLLGAIDAYEMLNPGSPKWSTSKETAVSELKKPKVTLIGFMQDHVILEMYMPINKETHREKMRVGEEMYGLKLEEIIGNNQGVRFRYGETGQTFDVLTKAAKSKQ